MESFIIEGGIPLEGTIKIAGAKNAACPIIMATMMNKSENIINNIPLVEDVFAFLGILEGLGAKVDLNKNAHQVTVDTADIADCDDIFMLARRICHGWMVHLEFVIGPLLARIGHVRINLENFGGCPIGKRPIDLHLKGFEALGAKARLRNNILEIEAQRLKGNDIHLSFPSVGATGNIMMVACRAKGITTIENAAKEPEIVDLAHFLTKMGAKIKGAGTNIVEIKGVTEMMPVEHKIISDRIEAGTYMIASAITSGDIYLKGINSAYLYNPIQKLKDTGTSVDFDSGNLHVRGCDRFNAVDVTTSPYPGFPTDLSPQFTALMTLARGVSIINETIFENRFFFVPELRKFCANIRVNGCKAYVRGVETLHGARVIAQDLRGGAALVLASLASNDQSEVINIHSIERGYEKIEEKLGQLGAKVTRNVCARIQS